MEIKKDEISFISDKNIRFYIKIEWEICHILMPREVQIKYMKM